MNAADRFPFDPEMRRMAEASEREEGDRKLEERVSLGVRLMRARLGPTIPSDVVLRPLVRDILTGKSFD